MDSILQSNIFFFITSVAVVILTAILVVAGYYLIKILRDVSEISEIANKAAEDANQKVRGLKEYAGSLLGFLGGKKKKHTRKE